MTTGQPVVTVAQAAPGVALLTLQRPAALNALDGALIAQLRAALAALRDDDRFRVVVLTGSGRAFCAGLDVKYYAERVTDPANRSPARRMELQQAIADLVTDLRSLRQPVIAAVNGAAAGGGMGLALASDLRVVADTATFHSAFIALGLGGTDIGVSWLLPRIVGATRAFEIMLTGRPIPATEALEMGLVNRVVAGSDLLDAALELAGQIAAHSPMGLWMTKEVMWSQLEVTSLRAGLDLENRSQVVTTLTNDHDEAVNAYLARRPPSFTNS